MSIMGSVSNTIGRFVKDGVVSAGLRFFDPSMSKAQANEISNHLFHKNTFAENSRSVATSMARQVTPNLAI